MAYKIAIGSSDGENVDISFGAATYFDIYEVEGENYRFVEKRQYAERENSDVDSTVEKHLLNDECGKQNGCSSTGKSCGNGSGGGCGGHGVLNPKVELIADCRSVVCKKIGFNVTKQLEKKAIAGFDVECSVKEALDKITRYFYKVDSHQSLRGSAREK